MLEDKNMVLVVEWADRVLDAIKNHSDDAVVVWVKIEYLPRRSSAKAGCSPASCLPRDNFMSYRPSALALP